MTQPPSYSDAIRVTKGMTRAQTPDEAIAGEGFTLLEAGLFGSVLGVPEPVRAFQAPEPEVYPRRGYEYPQEPLPQPMQPPRSFEGYLSGDEAPIVMGGGGGGGASGGGWVDTGSLVELAASTRPVVVGGTTAIAKFGVVNDAVGQVTQAIRAVAAQTADMFQVQNSAGAVISSIPISGAYNVFATAGDANPATSVDSGGYRLGPGGGSALDLRLRRTAAKTLTIDDNASGGPAFIVDAGAIRYGSANVTGFTPGFESHHARNGTNVHVLDVYDTFNLPTFLGRKARGTFAAPSAVLSGDQLVSFSARGFDGTAFSSGSRGRAFFAASENWTTTAHGTEWFVAITANGTTAAFTALSVRNNGDLRMEGNFNYIPTTDSQGNVGTAANRFTKMAANTYNVFGAASDANAQTSMAGQAISMGAGGASAQDLRLRRTAANTLTIDNNSTGGATVVPAVDNVGSIGTNALRWNLVRAVTITSGDLNLESEDGKAKWTLKEEPDRLVVVNRNTGKKFELVLKEISA